MPEKGSKMLSNDDIKDLVLITIEYRDLSYDKRAEKLGIKPSTYLMRLKSVGLLNKHYIHTLCTYVTFMQGLLSATDHNLTDLYNQTATAFGFKVADKKIFDLALIAINNNNEIIYKCKKTS